MKKIWRMTAWLILFTMIFSILPSNLVTASNNKIEINEEISEDELKLLLEDLFREASENADKIVDELELIKDDASEIPEELMEEEKSEESGELDKTVEEIDPMDLDEEQYREWKSNLLGNDGFNKRFSLYEIEDGIMSNEYIGVKVHENGLINMGTTGGNPDISTDNNKDLLYSYPNGSTSFTTIRVDGRDYRFNADTTPGFNEAQTESEAIMTIGDITISQIISFMQNPNTGRKDIAEIRYDVNNNSESEHSVGIRIMLDTMLGDNDGAPFKVPGLGNVTKEVEIVGNRVPQYWQAFDNLERASIVGSGSFYRNFSEKPDKVQFVAWPNIYGTDWGYEINPETSVTRDSAVGIYFNPREVRSRETITMATYYGIGDFSSSDIDDDLSLSVTAPQGLEVNTQTGNYYSNPFTITAYIKNNSRSIAENVKLNLNLPTGGELRLSGTGSSTINVGDLAVGEEKVVSFSVMASSQTANKTVRYNMKLESNNIGEKLLNFELNLPKATISANGSISLDKTSLTLERSKTFKLKATLNDIRGNVTWFSDNTTVASVDNSGLVTGRSPGSANIKASVGGKTATCRVNVGGQANNLTGISFSKSNVDISINQSHNLNLIFTPANASNKKIRSWTTSNSSIATVNQSGRVTGLKKGTVTIKAVTESGNIAATCTVKVVELEPVLVTGGGIKFNDNATGPIINFAGKSFPLFNMKIGTELGFADKIKLVFDPYENTFVAYVGDLGDPPGTNDVNPDGTLTDGAKQLRKDAYKTIKGMMNSVGKKTNREFYNSYRKLIQKSSPFAIAGKKSVFGYVEFTKTNTGYRLASGEICVLFEGSLNVKYKFPPAPIAYVNFSVGGSAQTGLELRLKEAGNISGGVNVAGKVDLSFNPSIGIGADIGVANVEGGLEGEMNTTMRFSPRFSFDEATIGGKLYLKYQAFVFINNKHWIDLGNYKFYPSRNNRMNSLSVMEIDYDELVLMPRDYTLRPSEFLANSPKIATFGVAQGNITYNTFKNNVYPDGKPQLALLPDGKMFLAWIGDDTSRTNEANYTAVYYSIYDGETWSEPKQLDDDGTGDFAPYVMSLGDEVYITWQNSEIQFDGPITPEDMAENMGIKLARWKNGEVKVYDITDPDQKLDNAPIISGNKGEDKSNIWITWTKNTANDIFGIEGKNIILSSSLYGDSFTDPIEILESDKSINGLTSSYDNGKNIVAYIQDMGTLEDRELMMIIGNDTPIRITENEIAEFNPKLINNGKSTELYWYSEEGINCIPDIDKGERYLIGEETLIGSNFDVVINGGERAIIWENSKGFRSDLFGIFYDSNFKKWGDAVQLTDLDTRIRGTSTIIKDDGDLHMAYISVPVLEKLEEGKSPFGDADLMFSELKPGYDLMVDPGLTYDSRLIYEESDLTIGCYVENQGQRTIEGLIAKVYNEGTLVSEEDIDIVLDSGKGEFIDVPYKLLNEITQHQISITILPKNGTDYDDSNNTASVSIGEAEILINKPIVTGMGSSRTIKVDIRNIGYAGSDEIIVELRTKEDDKEVTVDTVTIGSIPSQGARIVELNMPINNRTFSSNDQDSILAYVNVMDKNGERLDSNFVEIQNMYELDAITLSSVDMAGNTIILNMDNNLPELVKGVLCVESIDESDNPITYAQQIHMESLYGESMQLDLSGVEMDYNILKVYVLDEDDKIISNVVDINEPNLLKISRTTATPISGVYNKSQTVTLATTTEGANIYYTTDGSEPTIHSTLYTNGIIVDNTKTIKAMAIKEGMVDSECRVFQYVIQKDSPPTPPVNPSIPYPETSQNTTVTRNDKEKEKTFVDDYNKLSDKQKSAILNSIPYTINIAGLNMEQLKSITHNNFNEKQLQALVKDPEIFIKFLKDNNIDFNIMNLSSNEKLSFTDISKDHWAKSYIDKALGLGYISGFEDGTFRPNNKLVVGDTLAFLDRVVVANNILNTKLPRNIVESYITNKEQWAYYNMASIGSRLSESTLKKICELEDGTVPREMVAQIVFEITEGKLPDVKELKEFDDISQSEYKEALNYCIKIGLLSGTSNTTMEPKKSITRAEMMIIISRLDEILKNVNKAEFDSIK